ncbi:MULTISPECIES: phosphatidylserine decarboxylase [Mycolicibacterium]|uniref:Phosphatidylserine decarboxylase proenzyme n=2 Tax=Mycolicibacterium TaxID=1866885 RepID=PSD_MYCVP|nr:MULTISPECIES: phosphatidylserine decarboxylase [Mycolicibacterium]A1T339.1 RecName: Full=Phosphatidylserine decarboxylase proenzyme; Contains: RecName: Full=Phosphatidylserine decarboxylase alpha chain; Contains: RecName: Full=Phosphatidylserine decarboxylase beta chain [Mycolicibacterium vanbaalenii PYR-1]ABM11589.1 phosphatidylserine decarboxylase related protein [Mycolicibacterium vanbaalenii PYR-1]MCV7126331.1 phosphatidylserine decarboxylase [Mycolicibacterium vanbaalenii PYR-1]MDN45175
MARRPDLKTGPARLAALVRTSVPPMHPAGLPFVGASLAVALAGRKSRWLRNAGVASAAANAAFFRHPPRTPPTRPGVVVAPADGLICLIEEAVPPSELRLPATPLPRISIFLSLLDAHVQRAPLGGEVIAVEHRPGLFGSADLAAASADNERNSIVIRSPEGAEVIAVQIAGLLARRIVCDVEPGDTVGLGDTYGLIRYGSRLDTYLPAGSDILVDVGQRTLAGETVLAELPR